MRSSLLFPALLLAGCTATTTPPAPPGLAGTGFGEVRPDKARTLVLVLHDDYGPTHQSFARAVSEAIPGSLGVALLRPGYSGVHGTASPGARGADAGGGFSLDQISALASTVATYRQRYDRARIILAGEGGGAALAANLAAAHPDLVDGLVLVSCPCVLPEWRAYMAKRVPGRGWNAPVASLDPLQTAGGLDPDLKVAILVGARDDTTPATFSRPYAEALALRGIATDFRILPDRNRNLLLDPETVSATKRIAAQLAGRT